MWSACPWVIAIWVGSTSSTLNSALGLLGLRNGSVTSVTSPSLNSKQECPWNLISISVLSFRLHRVAHLFLKCPPDRDTNHHPHPRLLGEQGADGGDALVGVGNGRGSQALRLVRLTEPASLGQRRGKHLLQLRRRPGDQPLGLGEPLRIEHPLDRRFKLALVRHARSLDRRRRGHQRSVAFIADAASPAAPPTAPPTRQAT